VIGPLPPSEFRDISISSDDCLSLRVDDPFVPVGVDLDRNDRLREVLLDAFSNPVAASYARRRLALYVSLVPVAFLAIVGCESVANGGLGQAASAIIDCLCVVLVAIDIARPVPRHTHLVAAVFGATALRIAHLASARCSDPSCIPLLGAALIAAFGAVAMLVAAPSPRAMADHVRSALAMAPPTILPPLHAPGFYRYIIYAICAAAVLPILLWLLRSFDSSLGVQLGVFAAFAVVVPYIGRVVVGRDLPIHRDIIPSAFGMLMDSQPNRRRISARVLMGAMMRAASAAIVCLVLAFALVRGCQSAIEIVGVALRWASSEPSILFKLLDAQRDEAGSNPSGARWLLLTVLVVPLAEEFVYRGLVQHALRRRVRRRVAIGLSSVLFGLAHLVVFPMSVHQTILLGLSFGLAYERAGIIASVMVHVLWNLWVSI